MWPIDADSLIDVQRELARTRAQPWHLRGEPRIGACWVCFPRGLTGPGGPGDRTWAAVVVMHGGLVLEQQVRRGVADAPYRPGLMALRIGRLMEATVRALTTPPDVLLVDATGMTIRGETRAAPRCGARTAHGGRHPSPVARSRDVARGPSWRHQPAADRGAPRSRAGPGLVPASARWSCIRDGGSIWPPPSRSCWAPPGSPALPSRCAVHGSSPAPPAMRPTADEPLGLSHRGEGGLAPEGGWAAYPERYWAAARGVFGVGVAVAAGRRSASGSVATAIAPATRKAVENDVSSAITPTATEPSAVPGIEADVPHRARQVVVPARDSGEGDQEREVLQTAVAEADQEHGDQEGADADAVGARDGPRHERHRHSGERDQGHEETPRAVAVGERPDPPPAERGRQPHQEQAAGRDRRAVDHLRRERDHRPARQRDRQQQQHRPQQPSIGGGLRVARVGRRGRHRGAGPAR